MMRTIPFGETDPKQWDIFSDHSPEAWLFHSSPWINIESKFFANSNHSFCVVDDHGELLAICPMFRRDLGRGEWVERLLDTGHHRHSGPAFRTDISAPSRKAAAHAIMNNIFDLADKLDADRILLNTNNLAPGNRTDRCAEIPFWVRDFGFELGLYIDRNGEFALPNHSTVCADQIVDLSLSEQTLFTQMNPNFRKAVRKACRNGITFDAASDFVESSTVNRFRKYYEMALISAQRTGESLPPRDYYESIGESLTKARQAAVLFARYQGDIVAGIILLIHKGSAFFLASASHTNYLQLRVNNYLHWEAIRWAKAQSLSRYRLGPIFPSLPKEWPVCRVSRMKGDLGGTCHTIIQGCYFRKVEQYYKDIVSVARRRSTAA